MHITLSMAGTVAGIVAGGIGCIREIGKWRTERHAQYMAAHDQEQKLLSTVEFHSETLQTVLPRLDDHHTRLTVLETR